MSQAFRKSMLRVAAVLMTVPLAACPSSDLTEVEVEPGDELNFFEQELVGLWSRYHSYDGSDQYIRFNADRTACKWEEASGSDARTSKSSYSDWRIDDTQAPASMMVQVQGAGIDWYLDYPDNEIWPSGYRSTLTRWPSTSAKLCD